MRRLAASGILLILALPCLAQSVTATIPLTGFEGNARLWPGGNGDKGGEGSSFLCTTEHHSGKASLVFHRDFTGTVGVGYIYARLFAGLQLPGRPTEVRLWAKGDGSGLPLNVRYVDGKGEVWQRAIGRLDSTEWRQFAFPLSAEGAGHWGGPQDESQNVVDLPITFNEIMVDKVTEDAPPAGDICLDDVEVVTTLTAEEALALSVGANQVQVTNRRGPYVFKVEAELSNYSENAVSGSLRWRLADYRGVGVDNAGREVALAPGESRRYPLKVSVPAAGWYSLELRARLGEVTREATVTLNVIRPSAQKATDAASAIGINGHLASAPEMQRMQQGGIKWMRADWLWGIAQGRPGDYDWTVLDSRYKAALESGISLLPVLCYGVDWATTKPADAEGSAANYMPKLPEWLAYVRAVVERYKAGIHAWEVWNEPNIGFWLSSNEEYVTLLKATYQAIKAVDPTATVLMGGTAGSPVEYIEMLYKAGCKDFTDGINIHPYQYPTMPDDGMARQVRGVWEVMRRYGDEHKPLWATEVGYPNHIGWNGVNLRLQADYIARTYICLLGSGVQRVIWYDYQNGDDPFYNEANFGVVLTDNSPKPCFHALHTVSDVLQGAQFVEQAAAPEGVAAYRFRRADGREVLCLWALEGQRQVALAGETGWGLRDLMGNERAVPEGKPPLLRLDTSPLFVVGQRLPRVETALPVELTPAAAQVLPGQEARFTVKPGKGPLAQAVVKATVEAPAGWTATVTQPPAGEPFEVVCTPGAEASYGEQEALLTLRATGGGLDVQAPVKLPLTLLAPWQVALKHSAPGAAPGLVGEISSQCATAYSVAARWSCGPVEQSSELTLGARARLKLEAPEAIVRQALEVGNPEVALQVTAPRTPPTRTVARLADARALRLAVGLVEEPLTAALPGVLRLDDASQVREMAAWGGPADLGALARLLWDEKELVVRVQVRDDVFRQPWRAGEMWRADSLQLAVDPAYTLRGEAPYAEYDVALSPEGPAVLRRHAIGQGASAARVEVARTESGANHTVHIPWAELGGTPHRGQRIGFSLLVNDDDGSGRDGWIEWGAGIGFSKDPSLYLDVTLAT